jgi:hypothetical protein
MSGSPRNVGSDQSFPPVHEEFQDRPVEVVEPRSVLYIERAFLTRATPRNARASKLAGEEA